MPEGRILETQIVEEPSRLVRAIGRWSLAALMVNIMIGSGIFGLRQRWLGCWGGTVCLPFCSALWPLA